MQIIKGRVKKPFNILIYGQPGVGKTTWAAKADKPIFICSDELDEADVDRFPKITSSQVLFDQINYLIETNTDYKTVVVDTIDAIERIFQKEILDQEPSDKTRSMNKAAGGYGNAYTIVLSKMTALRDKLSLLRDKKGMNIILICHSSSKVTNDPLVGDSYNEYYLSIHEKAQNLFVDWVSAVLFMAFDIVKSKDEKFAFSDGDRVMYTEKRAGFLAKNRYALPYQMELDFKSFERAYENFYHKESNRSIEDVRGNILGLMQNISDQDLIKKINEQLTKSSSVQQYEKIEKRIKELIGG